MVQILLVSESIPLTLAAYSSVPNMVSIPYSEPLWFVSEEVDLDIESELSKDRKFRAPENSHDHMPCFRL